MEPRLSIKNGSGKTLYVDGEPLTPGGKFEFYRDLVPDGEGRTVEVYTESKVTKP